MNNDLEIALQTAALEPSRWPRFYQELLSSTVLALTASPLPDHGPKALDDDLEVMLKCWQGPDGLSFIPFFTSLDALQHSITGPEKWISIPGETLLDITSGNTLILNPKSPLAKTFGPDERALIASLKNYADQNNQ